MKIRYFSDLHLEFIKPNKMPALLYKIKPNNEEICVLAGDIGNPYHSNYDQFMDHMNKNMKKTFIIPGNHEYYNNWRTIEETNNYLSKLFSRYPNISFLNNSTEHYENHCFIGTTLWSKITNPSYEINDVHAIPKFDYISYNRMNMLAIDFINDELEKNKKCIVITHHVPSPDLIHIKYKTPNMVPYNQWFSCDMSSVIAEHHKNITCWIYGHTHTPSVEKIHDIPFLCNPIGYPNENPKPDFQKTIDLYR